MHNSLMRSQPSPISLTITRMGLTANTWLRTFYLWCAPRINGFGRYARIYTLHTWMCLWSRPYHAVLNGWASSIVTCE